MADYELGKDIQDIKTRLDSIEEILESGKSQVASSRPCGGFSSSRSESELVQVENEESVVAGCKSSRHGRIDKDECECREQTLEVCPDGSYRHIAIHHNHSNFPDDGDDHALHVQIRAGDEIVHAFSSKRFVPRGKDRSKTTEGNDDAIKRRFGEIDNWTSRIECD